MNEGGVVTVYAIGDKPIIDYTIQATILEVVTSGGGNAKIIGNTVGTTMPRTNWEQTNPNEADYLKGRDALEMLIQTTSANAAKDAKNIAEAANKVANSAKEIASKALPKTGGIMEGNIDMNGKRIVGLPEPTEDSDIITKAYMENYTGTYINNTFLGGEW